MHTTYEPRGDVALITIDRPDVFNAIDAATSQGLRADLARAGEEARAAVLTGAGKAFSAGVDLASQKEEYETTGPDLTKTLREVFNPLIEALHDCRVPTVAAVNGASAGAGMGIALACDLRVMAPSAFFMSAFINVAVIPDSGSSWALPSMVGVSRAMEIAYSGRRVPADESVEVGLAHRIAEDPVAEALDWAARLANGPTDAYVATRHMLHAGASRSAKDILAMEEAWQGQLGSAPDHLEAVAAFLEKRPPNFRR